MTQDELAAACRQLYGARWQAALARDIARERETVNRWARGKFPIPNAVAEWMEREFQRRGWAHGRWSKGLAMKETKHES